MHKQQKAPTAEMLQAFSNESHFSTSVAAGGRKYKHLIIQKHRRNLKAWSQASANTLSRLACGWLYIKTDILHLNKNILEGDFNLLQRTRNAKMFLFVGTHFPTAFLVCLWKNQGQFIPADILWSPRLQKAMKTFLKLHQISINNFLPHEKGVTVMPLPLLSLAHSCKAINRNQLPNAPPPGGFSHSTVFQWKQECRLKVSVVIWTSSLPTVCFK